MSPPWKKKGRQVSLDRAGGRARNKPTRQPSLFLRLFFFLSFRPVPRLSFPLSLTRGRSSHPLTSCRDRYRSPLGP
jgi:hypothetical protein